jgi:predicted nucleotidyltransferase
VTDRMARLRDDFLAHADQVLSAGYSAVEYGSAVRGDFLPGRSDCNLLVVAPGLELDHLRRLGPALGAFERERVSPPLLFTRAEWSRAADVFPIEITDMRAAYRVLRAPDPLEGLMVHAADLRRALEAELRGKLLRLRADYALYHDREDLLAAVVAASAGSLRVLLRGVLALAAHPPAADDAGLVRAVGAICECPAESLATVFAHRRDDAWRCSGALFTSYLAVVDAAVRFVDQAHPGAY